MQRSRSHGRGAALAVAVLGIGAGVTAIPAPAFAATVPGPPRDVVVTVGHSGLAEVAWHRPANNGGAKITGWVMRRNPNERPHGVANVADYGDHLATQTPAEYGETYRFAIAATNAAGTGPWSESAAPVTPIPVVSIANASTPEGNSGSHPLSFAVKLDFPSAAPVTVEYATKGGIRPDFVATSGTLTFAPGQTAKTVRVSIVGASDYATASGNLRIGVGKTAATILVPILGDGNVEPDETFFVDLDQPVGAVIADGRGVVTIRNDD